MKFSLYFLVFWHLACFRGTRGRHAQGGSLCLYCFVAVPNVVQVVDVVIPLRSDAAVEMLKCGGQVGPVASSTRILYSSIYQNTHWWFVPLA